MTKTIPHHRHKDSRKQWTDYQPEPADQTLYATSSDLAKLQGQIDLLAPQSTADLTSLKDDVAFLMAVVCPPKKP